MALGISSVANHIMDELHVIATLSQICFVSQFSVTRHWRYCNEIWTGVRFVVWETKRNVSVVCVCSAPNCCDTEQRSAASGKIIKEMLVSVASGTPYIIFRSIQNKTKQNKQTEFLASPTHKTQQVW